MSESGSGSRIAGRRIGPYVVEDELGRGGMGAVYRVRHANTGGAYALKVVRSGYALGNVERALARFRREAEVLARVDDHPGVVRVHAVGEERGVPWCAMELVDGEPLSARLRGGPMPAREAAALVASVARAVHHVHGHGVLHRDLKPQNVLIDRSGQPRVVDFGLAYDADAVEERLTNTGELLGTPGFMAPEQVHRRRRDAESGEDPSLGPATDVYALGAVLYATLTGEPPFAELRGVSMLVAVCEKPADPPSAHGADVPADLDAVCLQALEKAPGARYRSAAELADDLERWLRGESVTASGASGVGRITRGLFGARSRRLRIAVALVAAAALVAGAALGVRHVVQARREETERAERAWREARERLDGAFAAACSGDLDALADAERLLEAVERRDDVDHAGGDAVLHEHAEVIRGLARLAAGDEVAVRSLALDGPAWRPHRGAVVRVVAASGNERGLALILEREPVLLQDPALVAALAEAIASRAVAPTPVIVEAVVEVLAAEARDVAMDGARRRAARRTLVDVLVRRLETLLELDPVDPAALDALFVRLLPELRRLDGGGIDVDAAALDRLVAITDVVQGSASTSGEVARVLEAALTLLPPGDARALAIQAGLHSELVLARAAADGAARARAFEIGIMLFRLGEMPFRLHDLETLAPETADVEARAAEAEDPAVVAALFACLVERRAREGARYQITLRAALVERWRFVEELVARHRRRGDVPAFVFDWLAAMIERSEVWWRDSSPEYRAELAELAGRTFEVPAVSGDADRIADVIDGLRTIAFDLDRALPPERRRLHIVAIHARWFAERDRGASPVALAAIRDGIALARMRYESSDWTRDLAKKSVDRLVQAVCEASSGLARSEPPGGACRHEALLDELLVELGRITLGHHGIPLARSYHAFRHGDLEAGLALIAESRSTDPKRNPSTDAYLVAAEFLLDLGQDGPARRALEVTLEHELHVIALQRRSALWRRLGDEARAEADRRLAAAFAPR